MHACAGVRSHVCVQTRMCVSVCVRARAIAQPRRLTCCGGARVFPAAPAPAPFPAPSAFAALSATPPPPPPSSAATAVSGRHVSEVRLEVRPAARRAYKPPPPATAPPALAATAP